MFCPRCGQQAAEDVSFCSRCGLPLDAAAEIVASGGAAVTEAGAREPVATLTPRQRGTRKGLIIVIAGTLFFAVAALLTAIKEDLFVFFIPAGITVVLGVARMLYGLLLEEHAPPKKRKSKREKKSKRADESRAELGRTHARGGELPPARSVPASFYTKPGADTGDMSAASSVTENTTKLLDEQNHER
jgi:hypothetical protein